MAYKLSVAAGFSLRKEITHWVKIEKNKNPRNLKVAATIKCKNRSMHVFTHPEILSLGFLNLNLGNSSALSEVFATIGTGG
jgi:hypothetical protein